MSRKRKISRILVAFTILISIAVLFFVAWVMWSLLFPLKIEVRNESNVEISEAYIVFYYTKYDAQLNNQGIGEQVVYKFTKRIPSNDSRRFYPDFQIEAEGGLGFSYIDEDGELISEGLCSYIDSAPAGKFIITIDDKGNISVKKSGILMC